MYNICLYFLLDWRLRSTAIQHTSLLRFGFFNIGTKGRVRNFYVRGVRIIVHQRIQMNTYCAVTVFHFENIFIRQSGYEWDFFNNVITFWWSEVINIQVTILPSYTTYYMRACMFM